MISQVLENAIKDPSYKPYCLPCPGLHRMAHIERFYWECPVCHAKHDERENYRRYALANPKRAQS